MITYLIRAQRTETCVALARVRPAGLPFHSQDDGSLVGLDYTDYTGGGACNVRLTHEQATALRDALTLYLASDHTRDIMICKTSDGRLHTASDGHELA